jgi:hypothetical protein
LKNLNTTFLLRFNNDGSIPSEYPLVVGEKHGIGVLCGQLGSGNREEHTRDGTLKFWQGPFQFLRKDFLLYMWGELFWVGSNLQATYGGVRNVIKAFRRVGFLGSTSRQPGSSSTLLLGRQ